MIMYARISPRELSPPKNRDYRSDHGRHTAETAKPPSNQHTHTQKAHPKRTAAQQNSKKTHTESSPHTHTASINCDRKPSCQNRTKITTILSTNAHNECMMHIPTHNTQPKCVFTNGRTTHTKKESNIATSAAAAKRSRRAH